ncbi:DUF1456 family protein [Moraxella nasovis]|uniref:DUF1456 family protein n=1 Tax=Moraxella nasovis TaxID=2904121 RepID=UPI001F60A514|nr:DUF1456 family protein [Moraxella nasovis]UNU74085.1 DUF1456 family protein [Moraxella nasovis]
MNNNYVFNRLLTTLNLHRNHDMTAKIFKLGGTHSEITKSLVKSWRISDEQNRLYRPMLDKTLISFFDGLQQASKDELIDINCDIVIRIKE